MASEKTVLVTKPGTVSAEERKRLSEWGIVLIETDNVQDVRFLIPGMEIDSAGMLGAALRVLATNEEMKYAKKMQQEFISILLKLFEPKNTQ